MKQNVLTNWEATRIGLILSAGVAFLLFVLWPASLSFTVFATHPLIVIFLFGVTGALIGRLLAKTKPGAWLGAGIMIVLLGLWLYRIASTVPLD